MNPFRKHPQEKQLDRELRFHLQQQIDDYIAQGMPPNEACRRVRREFGGIEQVKDECRDVRPLRWLEQFFQDVRYGFRTLRASPGFTAVAILSLALGIGANTTIYSVVNELLLNDTTATDPDSLVRVGNAQSAFTGISYLNYRDLADSGVFKDLAAEIPMRDWNWRNGAGSERIAVMISSGNLFQTLGVEAALGRTFVAAETDPATNPQVVVISDGFWRRRLGADSNVLGRLLVMNDRPYIILGVLARNYRSLIGLSIVPEAFVPVTRALSEASRKDLDFNMIGRLRPGVTRPQALAALTAQVAPPSADLPRYREGSRRRSALCEHRRHWPHGRRSGRRVGIPGLLRSSVSDGGTGASDRLRECFRTAARAWRGPAA